MAKSRSESRLRGAKGKRTMPGPGKKPLRGAEIPRFTRNKLRNLKKGSLT